MLKYTVCKVGPVWASFWKWISGEGRKETGAGSLWKAGKRTTARIELLSLDRLKARWRFFRFLCFLFALSLPPPTFLSFSRHVPSFCRVFQSFASFYTSPSPSFLRLRPTPDFFLRRDTATRELHRFWNCRKCSWLDRRDGGGEKFEIQESSDKTATTVAIIGYERIRATRLFLFRRLSTRWGGFFFF